MDGRDGSAEIGCEQEQRMCLQSAGVGLWSRVKDAGMASALLQVALSFA
jgi:hypothetical protein